MRLAGSVRWRWRTIREWMQAIDTLKQLDVVIEEEPAVELPGEDDDETVEETGQERKSATGAGESASNPKKSR
jgi:hypothetical protein